MPLAYRVYEYDERGRELHPEDPDYVDLWCDLNFTCDGGAAAIDALTDDGRINMAAINEELEQLNDRFLTEQSSDRFGESGADEPGTDGSGPADRYPLAILLDPRRK